MLATIRHAWNRLRTIARPFREYDHRGPAVVLFIVIVTLLLGVAGLNIVNNYVGGHFMESLAQRDAYEFGRQLVNLNFLQLKKEADFRFGLIRTRENGEAIAMQGSEAGESRRLGTRLAALVENFKRVVAVQRNIQFFTVGYGYLTPVIPI